MGLWFPCLCIVCRAPGDPLCASCIVRLPRAGPVDGGEDVAWLAYEGPTRAVVAALKYRDAWQLVRPLGRSMASIDALQIRSFDVVTWAPTSLVRRRHRGGDQAGALAAAVGAVLRLPVRPLLARPPGAPQTARDLAGRQHGQPFTALRVVTGRRVLVVDDVITTGATMREARRALTGAGASSVTGLALAATPIRFRSHAVDRPSGRDVRIRSRDHSERR